MCDSPARRVAARLTIAAVIAVVLSSSSFAQDSSANDLRAVMREHFEAMAGHKGYLALDGLTTPSDEAARALAQHQGQLDLDGLAALSDEAAVALQANANVRLPSKFKPQQTAAAMSVVNSITREITSTAVSQLIRISSHYDAARRYAVP